MEYTVYIAYVSSHKRLKGSPQVFGESRRRSRLIKDHVWLIYAAIRLLRFLSFTSFSSMTDKQCQCNSIRRFPAELVQNRCLRESLFIQILAATSCSCCYGNH